MPSGRLKNAAYRLMLPFFAPKASEPVIQSIDGHLVLERKALERILYRHHMLAGSILISDQEDFSTIRTSILANDQNEIADPVYYRVASITKMATALIALILQDHGQLDLNEPVTNLLPGFKGIGALKDVTSLHLLTHTAGIADPAHLEQDLTNGLPLEDAVKDARFTLPGRSFRYSNLGFGILGCIFEAVTGLPLGEIYRNYLFEPLSMHATLEACSIPEEQIMPVVRILPYHPGSALRITKLGRFSLSYPDPEHHYGHSAGSMYTDIQSLGKLVACIQNDGRPLPSSGTQQMRKAHAYYGSVSPTLAYGIGLLIIRDPVLSEHRILGHQGFAYGCADGVFWEEDTGRTMIVLNGGCSEARTGRLGLCNRDMLEWAFRKELPKWSEFQW